MVENGNIGIYQQINKGQFAKINDNTYPKDML